MIDFAIPEEQEQEMIFRWAAYESAAHPELCMLYAIPNGGKRDRVTGARLKATGVKAGVPDMCLPVARGGYHGLYIELKRKKGGQVSDLQWNWLRDLIQYGYKAVVCKGFDEARAAILDYLGIQEN